jgi:hypothetical protein
MSYIARYDKGDWIALCDVCGRKYKASNLKKRWDGLMCCDDDWEIRQPQDFVRGIADTQIAPWLRSEPSNSFIPFAFTPPAALISVSETVTLSIAVIKRDYTNINLINGSVINKITLG